MATITPRPQLGAHVTIYTIIGQAVAADGTLSDSGSAISLWGVRRGLRMSTSVERTEINSGSRNVHNEVIVASGRSLSLDIFKVNNTADPNPLETLCESFDYFKVAWTAGTATGSKEACVFYGVRGDLNESMEGRGEAIASLELGPCDVGWATTAAGVGTTAQLTRTIS